MRIFNTLFAFAALVCVGLLSACESDPTTNDPQNDSPVINISDTTLEVSAEGGDYTIEFSITNAIGDVKVAATSAVEWLTVKEATQTSIAVNVAFNTEESERQTTLTVKYPQAEDVVISVTQAGKDGDPYTLTIKDVTYNKFVSDVTAQNDENYYVVYSSTVSYFQEMGIADADALLLDDYTFENFIVGNSNKFAHAACTAVANHPAENYNPLFIYGPSGMGKTHLITAIANEVRITRPEYNIVYFN